MAKKIKIDPDTGLKNPVPEKLKPHCFKSGAEWNGNAAGRPKGTKNKLRKTAEALVDMEVQSPAEVFIYIRETALANGDLTLALQANKELSKFVEATADASAKNSKAKPKVSDMSDKELKDKLSKFKIA